VETINRKKVRMEISSDKIADACNEAYQRVGENAYFGNGFEAGVQFAIKELESEKQELVEMLNKLTEQFSKVDRLYSADRKLIEQAKELIKRATE